MLKKGSVKRPSMSQYLPPSWPKSGRPKDRLHTLSSSSMSTYSTCSSGEADVFTSSESDETESDESTEVTVEEEGESRLTISEYIHFLTHYFDTFHGKQVKPCTYRA